MQLHLFTAMSAGVLLGQGIAYWPSFPLIIVGFALYVAAAVLVHHEMKEGNK